MGILKKRRLDITPTRQKTIICTGGLNEALSNLELKPGNLTECQNYVEKDGLSHGYTSYPGFERFDGQALASTIAVVRDADGNVTSEVAREAQRTLITALPGSGITRGVMIFDDSVYGFRDNVGATSTDMFKEGSGGWGSTIIGNEMTHDGTGTAFIIGETITGVVSGATGTVKDLGPGANDMRVDVTSGATAFNATEAVTGSAVGSRTLTAVNQSSLLNGGAVRTAEGRFALFNTNQPIKAIVDGVSEPHLFYNDVLSPIIESAGTLPSTYPTHVGIWKNRLFLAYPGGHLLFSVVGDPTDWDAASNAGEIYVGEDITDIVLAPGGKLIVTTLNKIRIISYETTAAAPDPFLFSMDEFSDTSGSIAGTMKRMLGVMYFCDDRGVTTLEAVQEFGDFGANTLAKNVEKTYQALRDNISTAHTDRAKNQYTIWFNNGTTDSVGLVFTFGHNKKLRGAGIARLPTSVECIAEGKTNAREDVIYFGDGSGYIHRMNSGTSFDGTAIITKGATAFSHYGSPNNWKHFRRLTFEVSADPYTNISYRMDFDYRNSKMPATETQSNKIVTGNGIWGSGVWGTFTWGASYLNRVKLRALGYGGNMRVVFVASSKYQEPHTVHNIITEYSMGSAQLN